MNFFKSILSEDPDPPESDESQGSEPTNPDPTASSQPQSDPNPDSIWTFGDFVKNLTTRSESVFETYRRDLEEFGSGLKKETELFKEAASRAVKDLPASIEVAQGMIKSTAEIISQGKDSLIAEYEYDVDDDINSSSSSRGIGTDTKRYSRFDAQVRVIQSDVSTFCEEVEDVEDYSKWKVGFVLEDKREEIEGLVEENGELERIYKRLVPGDVDRDTFWCRYFYRVFKLKQQEDMRANIVKRAIAIDDEEELSWDVDDEDEDEDKDKEDNVDDGLKKSVALSENEDKEGSSRDVVEDEEKKANTSNVVEDNVVERSDEKVLNEEVKSEGMSTDLRNDGGLGLKSEEGGVDSEGKVVDHGESCKESDISVVSTQNSSREEDLEWDEIEDIGSGDEKKVSQGGSPNKADLRKRLSAAEEDEDLSWDIEDDDEPAKVK